MAIEDESLVKESLLLEAVNILLSSIGQVPIESEADFDVLVEARIARDTLIEVKRAVLSEGWSFNTDEAWEFPPASPILSAGGGFEIPVPTNVLDAVADNGDVIVRNWRLYSKSKQSHIFTETKKCFVVWDMEFDTLTHPLRHYITIRAARVFAARVVGDPSAVSYTAADEEDALLACRRSEGRTGNYNMFNSTFGINNRVRVN